MRANKGFVTRRALAVRVSIFGWLLVCPSAFLHAQEGNVAGIVHDSLTGLPVRGVLVRIGEATTSREMEVRTDASGAYRLKRVRAGSRWIVASRFGYRTERQLVMVDSGVLTRADFVMSPREVIVQHAPATTGMETALTNTLFVDTVRSVAAMAGKVNVAAAQLRGAGAAAALNERDVLIFVDGIPLKTSGYTRDTSSVASKIYSLSNVDPARIEQIEVLGGPAALALYGSKAAHGVVFVHTKDAYFAGSVLDLLSRPIPRIREMPAGATLPDLQRPRFAYGSILPQYLIVVDDRPGDTLPNTRAAEIAVIKGPEAAALLQRYGGSAAVNYLGVIVVTSDAAIAKKSRTAARRSLARGVIAIANPDSLARGSLAHNVPPQMRQGVGVNVEASLSRGGVFSQTLRLTGSVDTVFIVPVMVPKYADLLLEAESGDSEAFKITASSLNGVKEIRLDSLNRLLRDTVPVRWAWKVTPLKSGEFVLRFILLGIRRDQTGKPDTLMRNALATIRVPVLVDWFVETQRRGRVASDHVRNNSWAYGTGGMGVVVLMGVGLWRIWRHRRAPQTRIKRRR